MEVLLLLLQNNSTSTLSLLQLTKPIFFLSFDSFEWDIHYFKIGWVDRVKQKFKLHTKRTLSHPLHLIDLAGLYHMLKSTFNLLVMWKSWCGLTVPYHVILLALNAVTAEIMFTFSLKLI